VLVDFNYIRMKGNDPLGDWVFYVLYSFPVAFFIANKGLLSKRTSKVRYFLVTLIALLLSVIWFVGSAFLLLKIHFARGGTE